MRALALFMPVVLLSSTGCQSEPSLEARSELAASLLAVSEIVRIALEPELPKADSVRMILTDLAEEARDVQEAGKLAALLFEEHGYVREVDDTRTEHTLLPFILKHKTGSCTGLSGLYLLLAEQAGLEARGMLVPGHFFVRVDDGKNTRNVELLRRGEEMPDAWYEEKWPHPKNADYMRPLSVPETMAVFVYNAANAFRDEGRLERAREMYERVIEVLPRFAEPRANLGSIHDRNGDIASACRCYESALAINPFLKNAKLLEERVKSRCGEKKAAKEVAPSIRHL